MLLAVPRSAVAQAVELASLLGDPWEKPPPPPPTLSEDLNKALEVLLTLPFGASSPVPGRIIDNINELNKADPDGFVKALTAARSDLRGLPFLLGKDSRMEEKQAHCFSRTVELIKAEVREVTALPNDKEFQLIATRLYWENLDKGLARLHEDGQVRAGSEPERAMTAALMQILVPGSGLHREFMARRLAKKKRLETTHALARLALFAPEDAVRAEAIMGLQGRPAKNYKEILMQGFRYPLPVVATRAATALVKLECTDSLADLIGVLERPDPRAPAKQKKDGKQLAVVRELVRVNHQRNCLLCHAPDRGAPPGVLTARMPLSNEPLVPGPDGYRGSAPPEFAVRIDVTYLRQDFSLVMKVENARPWPDMQRFDFLVRTRVLTAEEAAQFEKVFAKQGTPPSHVAAQTALRELTGQQPADTSAQAWRRLLNLR